jgi:hypothetical protein
MLYHLIMPWLIFNMALWLYLIRPAGTSFLGFRRRKSSRGMRGDRPKEVLRN